MTAPWIGEMSAEERAARIGPRVFREDIEAAIADAEARARAKALGEAEAEARRYADRIVELEAALRQIADYPVGGQTDIAATEVSWDDIEAARRALAERQP